MADQPVTQIALDNDGPTLAGRVGALIALFLLLGFTLLQIYRLGAMDENRGASFAYTQDKAYQHLVVGREVLGGTVHRGPAQFGGTTPLAASESPGWSLAMAVALGLPGMSCEPGRDLDEIALVPVAVNIAAAALLIAVAGHLVRREVRSGLWMLLFLLGMGMLIALPLLVLTGMEHIAHMVVVLLAVAVGLRSVDRTEVSVLWVLLAAVLTAINVALRYESLAVLLALVLWAWIQKRTGRKLFSVAAGLAVVVGVGAYLVAHGGSMVPNPVLVHMGKVFRADAMGWPQSLLEHVLRNLSWAILPWALLLMGVAMLASSRGRTHSSDPEDRRRVGWLFVFVVTGLIHLLIGPTDEYGLRHTAYLIPLGAVAMAMNLGAMCRSDLKLLALPAAVRVESDERTAVLTPAIPAAVRPWSRGNGLIAVVCLVPLGIVAFRAILGFVSAPQAVRDAYVRERLTASYVRTFWSAEPVAANQTGLLGYETQAVLVDLSGQADHKLARARFDGTYDRNLIAGEVARAQSPIALLMGSHPQVPVPSTWKLMGGWHEQGGDRDSASAVRVFSVLSGRERDVRTTLRLFSEQEREGIDFWFVEDEPSPSTQPGAVQ